MRQARPSVGHEDEVEGHEEGGGEEDGRQEEAGGTRRQHEEQSESHWGERREGEVRYVWKI